MIMEITFPGSHDSGAYKLENQLITVSFKHFPAFHFLFLDGLGLKYVFMRLLL